MGRSGGWAGRSPPPGEPDPDTLWDCVGKRNPNAKMPSPVGRCPSTASVGLTESEVRLARAFTRRCWSPVGRFLRARTWRGRLNFVAGSWRLRLRLRLGAPLPRRLKAAGGGFLPRPAGLGRARESRTARPPSFGTTPVRMWNWPLAPLLRRAGNQVVREMPSHTRPAILILTRRGRQRPAQTALDNILTVGTELMGQWMPRRYKRAKLGRRGQGCGGGMPPLTPPRSRPTPLLVSYMPLFLVSYMPLASAASQLRYRGAYSSRLTDLSTYVANFWP